MAYARDSEIPQIRTAYVQTIRVINPLKDPEKPHIDYAVPPSPTYTTYTSKTVSTFLHKPFRLAPQIRLTRQSIFSFVFGKIPLRAPPPTPSILAGAASSWSIRRWQPIAYLAACIILFALSIALGMTLLSGAGTPKPVRPAGLAASTVSIVDSTQQTALLFYQDASYELNLRITPDINNTSFSSPQQLALVGNQRPTQNISLAATSYSDTAGIYHQLFYIMNSSIMFLNLTCPSTSPTNCSVTAHNTVSNLSPAIASDSSIAATFTIATTGPSWQVFYHNNDYALSCLSFEDGAWNLTASIVGGMVVKGSDIAAVALDEGGVEVLYVDQGSKSLYTVGSRNGTWMSRKSPISSQPFLPSIQICDIEEGNANKCDVATQLTSQKAPGFSPTSSSLSLARVSASDNLYAYYTSTGSTSFIYQLLFNSANNSSSTAAWNKTPIQVGKGEKIGGVASISLPGEEVGFCGIGKDIAMGRFNSSSGVLVGGLIV